MTTGRINQVADVRTNAFRFAFRPERPDSGFDRHFSSRLAVQASLLDRPPRPAAAFLRCVSNRLARNDRPTAPAGLLPFDSHATIAPRRLRDDARSISPGEPRRASSDRASRQRSSLRHRADVPGSPIRCRFPRPCRLLSPVVPGESSVSTALASTFY